MLIENQSYILSLCCLEILHPMPDKQWFKDSFVLKTIKRCNSCTIKMTCQAGFSNTDLTHMW